MIRRTKEKAKRVNVNILCLCIMVLVFLLLPALLRLQDGNSTLIGEEPYYHARLAEKLARGDFSESDSLVSGGRHMDFTPYHFLAAIVSLASDVETALRVLPLLLGVLSAVLFYCILRRLGFESFTRIMAVLILSSSPAFIYAFSSMQASMAIALSLAGALFFLRKGRDSSILSFSAFLLAGAFSIMNMLLIMVPLLAYSLLKKERQRFSLALFLAFGILYILNPVPLLYNLNPATSGFLRGIISDVGGVFAIGIFYIILATIGIIHSWKLKKRYYPAYIFLALVLALMYIGGVFVMVYANFCLALFGALGLKMIRDFKWEMAMIKNLTFIVIACGLLFSMVSFSVRMSTMPPAEKTALGLEWIRGNSREGDVIVSHHSSGYFIEYFARRPVVIDSYFSSIQDFEGRYLDMYSLFHTPRLKNAEEIIGEYNIRYIAVTKPMRNGKVWRKPDEGLLYLFRNNETFKNVYSSDEVEIWKYIKGS